VIEYIVVCLVALFVSGLTLFSGFGLGTLLMPAFALFFPVPTAIAATAVVHLANNLFQAALVGRKASWPVVARFALPGAAAALAGAALLSFFAKLPPIWSYQLGSHHQHEIALIGLVIGALITSFAILDLLPRFNKLAFNRRYLPLGGVISGFFGGLSGLQGALRSAFLIKAGLDKESFIGTSIVSAIIVDAARLLVYGLGFYAGSLALIAPGMKGLVLAAMLAAFVGSFVGTRLMKTVTLHAIQIIVGVMLIVVGAGIAAGLF
jgi:uncharacterized membrane protein YfcA